MGVNAAGQFTGRWLFGAVIVTTQDVDGQDIMYASLTGSQLHDLLVQEFADAAALDSAAAALAARYGAPPRPIEVAVALPWLSPADAVWCCRAPARSTTWGTHRSGWRWPPGT